jgi:hypothetical protein
VGVKHLGINPETRTAMKNSLLTNGAVKPREESMNSNNWAVKLEVDIPKFLAAMDWSHEYIVLSQDPEWAVPNLRVLESFGATVSGEMARERVANYRHEDVTAFDFGNGFLGLTLRDERECHYLVRKGPAVKKPEFLVKKGGIN